MCLCIIQYTWISFRRSNVILDQTIFFTARTLCHFYINPLEHDKMSILNHSSVVGWKIRHQSVLVKKTAGQTCLLLRAAIHSQRTLQTFALSSLSGWEILRNKAESLDFHSVFHSNSARLFPSLGPFGDSSAPLFPRCMCARTVYHSEHTVVQLHNV